MKKLFRNKKENHPYIFENEIRKKRPPLVNGETAIYKLGKSWNFLKYQEITNMSGYI